MSLEPWDIDRFPLEKQSAPKKKLTPGQEAAEKFLREVQPGDLDRLTEQEYAHPDENWRGFGTPTSGQGHEPERYDTSHYPSEGYNQPDRRYPGEYPEGGDEWSNLGRGQQESWLRGMQNQGDYVLYPPPREYFGTDDDEDAYDEPVPETYHVVTRPTGTLDPHDRTAFTEHRVHTMGNRYEYSPHDVWEQFAQEHPEFDPEEGDPNAEHEIVNVHPEEHHDRWHRDLADEEADFDRIRQHGLHRESDLVGHQAYRSEEPSGVVHRLWHNEYSVNGPGWHTSRWDPALDREHQPVPWSEHPDNASEDPLGDALEQVHQNRQIPHA